MFFPSGSGKLIVYLPVIVDNINFSLLFCNMTINIKLLVSILLFIIEFFHNLQTNTFIYYNLHKNAVIC